MSDLDTWMLRIEGVHHHNYQRGMHYWFAQHKYTQMKQKWVLRYGSILHEMSVEHWEHEAGIGQVVLRWKDICRCQEMDEKLRSQDWSRYVDVMKGMWSSAVKIGSSISRNQARNLSHGLKWILVNRKDHPTRCRSYRKQDVDLRRKLLDSRGMRTFRFPDLFRLPSRPS